MEGSPKIIKTLPWPRDQTQPLLLVLQTLQGRLMARVRPACLLRPSSLLLPPKLYDFFLLVVVSLVFSCLQALKKFAFFCTFPSTWTILFFSSLPSFYSSFRSQLACYYFGKLFLTAVGVTFSSFIFPLPASVEFVACLLTPSTARL